jgi:hypothetical protein
MPASPPQNHSVELIQPHRERVSFEEATRCLNESQPEKLCFSFQREVDGYDEAYEEHRHQFIDAVNTCQSLKELAIEAHDHKLRKGGPITLPKSASGIELSQIEQIIGQ